MPVFTFDPCETRGRKRSYNKERAATPNERQQRKRSVETQARLENIAVLDMETDPFDKEKQDTIFPFVACLYSRNFDPIVIWEEDNETFCNKLIEAIEALPEQYTIYAHNGGKFDYMFLLHKLRGNVSFKGRGIMAAKIGVHELRDSFHIIPEKLAAYQKQQFDYENMRKNKRHKFREEIISYLISDCEYLLDIVHGFLNRFGLKLSIGQAAMAEVKKHYKVDTIGEAADTTLRNYFFGGRVECIAGKGHFKGDYKLYDVNSMYPYVMAEIEHPVSNNYSKHSRGINENTFFVEVSCRNFGALIQKSVEHGTNANVEYGRFFTTIHEFNTALELGLIDRVKIHSVIDCDRKSTFKDFVIPHYEKRLELKPQLKQMEKEGRDNTPLFFDLKKDDIFTKLLLNNAYGKYAQNPRRFKENFITDPDAECPEGYDSPLPAFRNDEYAIWQRPSKNKRFNNVGTAASITGAARAVLMKAIASSYDPIYCDTDSLICRELNDHVLNATELGAWDLEAEFSEVIVVGKKMYACKVSGHEDKYKIRSKGVSGLTWADMQKMLLDEIVEVVNFAPTLMKNGTQNYMTRKVRATAPPRRKSIRIVERLRRA